jgi:hypothetical protein
MFPIAVATDFHGFLVGELEFVDNRSKISLIYDHQVRQPLLTAAMTVLCVSAARAAHCRCG